MKTESLRTNLPPGNPGIHRNALPEYSGEFIGCRLIPLLLREVIMGRYAVVG
jgi:hypothetical protein